MLQEHLSADGGLYTYLHDQRTNTTISKQWTVDRANNWYACQGWILGCNYIPASAINQLEMWQPETFDPAAIDRELSWAASIGFNSIRVFLHHSLWEQDAPGLLSRMELFLTIADSHKIRTMFVLFDAVWNPFFTTGSQPEPKKNVHNSGWVQSPGAEILKDTSKYDSLKSYVQGVIHHFRQDERVQVWDLFNEPDNMNNASYFDQYHVHKADLSLLLLQKTFEWARAVDPIQPLTAAPWQYDWSDTAGLTAIDNFMFTHSDVITFHCYENRQGMADRINLLKRYHRPLLCTEFMSRNSGSTFQEILPLLKDMQVGGYSWGLVAGKTQTNFPWDSWQQTYELEPEIWFHDIFRQDGSPFDPAETEYIKILTDKTDNDCLQVA
jgi:hypothetical protein